MTESMGNIHFIPIVVNLEAMRSLGLLKDEDELFFGLERGMLYGFLPTARNESQRRKWISHFSHFPKEGIRDGINRFMRRKFSAEDKVIVWHDYAATVRSMLPLYMICSLVPCRICELVYTVSYSGRWEGIDSRDPVIRELSPDEIERNARCWNELSRSNGKNQLRYLGDRAIKACPVEYFDEFILALAGIYCKDAPLEISDFYDCYRWHLPHYEDPYAIEDELYFADRIDHIVETGKLKREYGVYRPIDRSSILSRSLLNWRAYVQRNHDLYGEDEFLINSDNPLKPFLKIPDFPF